MDLEDEVKNLAGKLGFNIDVEPDNDLKKYTKGEPLLFSELKRMKDGRVVWATFRKDGEPELRVNGPYKVYHSKSNSGKDTWKLDDGSSFLGGAFSKSPGQKDDEQCEDPSGGKGALFLWKAAKI